MNSNQEREELLRLLKEAIIIINNGELKQRNAYRYCEIKDHLIKATVALDQFFDSK